jgi:hypothetical protein
MVFASQSLMGIFMVSLVVAVGGSISIKQENKKFCNE